MLMMTTTRRHCNELSAVTTVVHHEAGVLLCQHARVLPTKRTERLQEDAAELLSDGAVEDEVDGAVDVDE